MAAGDRLRHAGRALLRPSRDGGTCWPAASSAPAPICCVISAAWTSRPMSAQPWSSSCGLGRLALARGCPARGGAVAVGLAQEITALSEPGPLPLADRLSRREQLLRLVDPHLLGGFWWMLLESDAPPLPPGLIARLCLVAQLSSSKTIDSSLHCSAVTEQCHSQTTNPLDCWV